MAQTAQTETARGQWDKQSTITFGARCKLMLYGQGGPSGEGHLRPEMVSLPSRSDGGTAARPAQGHLLETRSVSFLLRPTELQAAQDPRGRGT